MEKEQEDETQLAATRIILEDDGEEELDEKKEVSDMETAAASSNTAARIAKEAAGLGGGDEEEEDGDDVTGHLSVYEQMLQSKQVQNSPLPLPVSSAGSVMSSSMSSAASGRASSAALPHPPLLQSSVTSAMNASVNRAAPDMIPHGSHENLDELQDFRTPAAIHVGELEVEEDLSHSIAMSEIPVAAATLVDVPEPDPVVTVEGGTGDGGGGGSISNEKPDMKPTTCVERCVQRPKLMLLIAAVLIAVIVVAIAVPLATSSSSDPSPMCFEDYAALEIAVDEYLAGGSRRDAITRQFGAMNTWCVSNVQNFDRLFSAVRNENARDFNEPLWGWDVSNAVSTQDMFLNATAFDQPLSSWDVKKIMNMAGMFLGASSFRQDLCKWMRQISPAAITTEMFQGSNCDIQLDPWLGNEAYSGGFVCTVCPGTPAPSPAPAPTPTMA